MSSLRDVVSKSSVRVARSLLSKTNCRTFVGGGAGRVPPLFVALGSRIVRRLLANPESHPPNPQLTPLIPSARAVGNTNGRRRRLQSLAPASVHPFIDLSIHPSIHPSIYLSIFEVCIADILLVSCVTLVLPFAMLSHIACHFLVLLVARNPPVIWAGRFVPLVSALETVFEGEGFRTL